MSKLTKEPGWSLYMKVLRLNLSEEVSAFLDRAPLSHEEAVYHQQTIRALKDRLAFERSLDRYAERRIEEAEAAEKIEDVEKSILDSVQDSLENGG